MIVISLLRDICGIVLVLVIKVILSLKVKTWDHQVGGSLLGPFISVLEIKGGVKAKIAVSISVLELLEGKLSVLLVV